MTATVTGCTEDGNYVSDVTGLVIAWDVTMGYSYLYS